MDINWDTVAALATSVGVAIAAWQIRESRKLAQSSFEDSLDQQYRELAHGIPVDVLLGKEVQVIDSETRELIYNYLDLTNEQIYLRKKGRITKSTWVDWCKGIEGNLHKPAFNQIWGEVKEISPETFTSLEKLESTEFKSDPRTWSP